jgi:hypothetical protein
LVGRSAVVVLVVAFVAMFAACGWDWTVVPKPTPSDAGEAGVSQDGTCGSNAECRSDEFCRFSDGRCGSGQRGTCVVTPPAKECDSAEEPPYVACGCDGKTAKNACSVEMARIDVSMDTACTAPPDTLRCGYYFCPRSTFCYQSVSAKGDFFFCSPWPCAEQSCACKDLTPKCPGATCSTDSAGLTTVVCSE